MSTFHYQEGELHIEDVPAREIAEQFGTPAYVYSATAIETAWREFDQAFAGHDHLVCYAVKANSNLGVLSLLARLGSGFDIVSGGELERVLRAGGQADKIVFSGVGKTAEEMRRAVDAGIACFNVESASELRLLNTIAGELGTRAPMSIRVNPDVDPRTHPYIATGLRENKFGIASDAAVALYHEAASLDHLDIRGIDCHIGSQITEISPFVTALARVLELVDELEAAGIELDHVDVGGGLGVRYRDEEPVHIEDYARAILETLGHRRHRLMFEPGRYIVANAGILLSRVITLKDNEDKHFAVIDAAMNDLIRPALYQSWHDVRAVSPRAGEPRTWEIVGPVCETGDFLARNRSLCIDEGDLVAIDSAGAYSFVMSSNYNTRGRAPEIMVSGHEIQCVRERESIDDQLRLERVFRPPD